MCDPSMLAQAEFATFGRFVGMTMVPQRHDCCLTATPREDLTLIAATSRPRRFLATPLDEIICHGAREG
jgi:hypothetical protein